MQGCFDIIIIGAGPSGCMASILLTKHFRVLMLDRCQLPREKSCSGVLIKKSVDLIARHVGEVPKKVRCTPHQTTGLTVITSDRSYDFIDAGLNIVRSSFDFWLAQEACARGAVLTDGAIVTGIVQGEHGVSVSALCSGAQMVFEAKILIACDGVNGCSRNLLGLGPQRKIVTCQKYYRAEIDMDMGRFCAFTSAEFSRYDAWVNTKDEMVVVGSIAGNRVEAERYQAVFAEHLRVSMGLRIFQEVKTELWCLPLVVPEPDLVLNFSNVFFSGEAAGLLNPFGEGMSIGMSSSIALAQACIEHRDSFFRPDAVATAYRERMVDELAYMKRQWGYLRRIAPEFWVNASGLN